MGCLKSLIKKIIILLILIAFFALGGWAFLREKINDYKNPQRSEFIETEKTYADFSNVPSDYQLTRSYNFFGYKKINAKYLPTGQKITIFDLKNEEKISPDDFNTKEIDEKINLFLNNIKDYPFGFENFEIVQRGSYLAQNKTIPFVKFCASVKNVPFKNVIGIIAAYSTPNKKGKPSTKIITSIVDKKAFNPQIIATFINSLRF